MVVVGVQGDGGLGGGGGGGSDAAKVLAGSFLRVFSLFRNLPFVECVCFPATNPTQPNTIETK